MELLKFDLQKSERKLKLKDYELVAPIAEELLEKGYSPKRVAALMFQYGYSLGRKLMRDANKERRIKRIEKLNKSKDENESQTSGENEGSV